MKKILIIGICVVIVLVVGCDNLRDYPEEEKCFEDIAEAVCNEKGEEYYKLDYSSGHNIITWHSNLPLSFICTKGNEDLSQYVFTREQLEECIDSPKPTK